MLPHGLPLEDLDEGIRNLVIDLNRIPGVFTNTTCEGHIWKNCPNWPTKDGWIHFNVENGTNSDLIPRIKREFLEQNKIFGLNEWGNRLYRSHAHYTMNAHYESHDDGSLFDRISKQEQEEYFKRAEERRQEILRGWTDLDSVIVAYLIENFERNYQSLPFRVPKP